MNRSKNRFFDSYSLPIRKDYDQFFGIALSETLGLFWASDTHNDFIAEFFLSNGSFSRFIMTSTLVIPSGIVLAPLMSFQFIYHIYLFGILIFSIFSIF